MASGTDVNQFQAGRADINCRLFDKRISLEPSYPSVLASRGELYAQDAVSDLSQDEIQAVRHAPPG